MNISQVGLDLIKEFEGLLLQAAPDPIGIPTIGYGTIRYPNGQKVHLGDKISLDEAIAFMKFECDACAADLGKDLAGVVLNQNQCDALISFCFNLGFGAFLGSTLRTRLKAGDFGGAADEFLRWDKVTQDGVKVPMAGLTRRRQAERALFIKVGSEGTPLKVSPSQQEKAVSAKAYHKEGRTVIVTLDVTGTPLEVITFQDSKPATLLALLSALPNLQTFEVANTADPVPAGALSAISTGPRPTTAVTDSPILQSTLLAIGSSDGDSISGNDVREMQTRLIELGYLAGQADGNFGPLTDIAVRHFQAEHFSPGEVDGLVGPRTWEKLFSADAGVTAAPSLGAAALVPGKTYFHLTNSGSRDGSGCFVLIFEYIRNGVLAGTLQVCSGQPRRQSFRTGANSVAGSLEPLPEGQWSVGPVAWADGENNYNGAVWNDGLGPAKIPIEYLAPATTGRGEIRIHIDWNRETAPGTAGCIGIRSVADYKTLVGWMNESHPRNLYVDWGLGTCPSP